MEIIITQWALDSYLDLRGWNTFTEAEYWNTLRPDVLLLQTYPDDLKFQQNKFWSPAQDRNGRVIPGGYKMKWHQIGSGLIQLRLTVAIFNDQCILCEAYAKKDDKAERSKLARFKVYLDLIRQGRYTIRGKLT